MNLSLLLEIVTGMHPDRDALVDGGSRWTFSELAHDAARWASWLRREAPAGPVLSLCPKMRRPASGCCSRASATSSSVPAA